jgi:NADH-ubiquinone oxidoreductase chain 2
VSNNKEHLELLDKNNSPVQLINQLRGYFYVNPLLALSLAITIFSFAGIPPLVGFFAKQMVLSAALDKGYVFLALIAILTSVIGGVYYLNIIKEIFFFTAQPKNEIKFNYKNITISSPMSITISIITLIILLFIFMNKE